MFSFTKFFRSNFSPYTFIILGIAPLDSACANFSPDETPDEILDTAYTKFTSTASHITFETPAETTQLNSQGILQLSGHPVHQHPGPIARQLNISKCKLPLVTLSPTYSPQALTSLPSSKRRYLN